MGGNPASGRWNLSTDPSSTPALPFPDLRSGPDGRAARVSRWLDLARTALPALAARHRWPIRRDHCLMRVCLDHAVGAPLGVPWDRVVRRPALRHLTDAQLDAAIACAERVLHDPDLLPALNRASLVLRLATR